MYTHPAYQTTEKGHKKAVPSYLTVNPVLLHPTPLPRSTLSYLILLHPTSSNPSIQKIRTTTSSSPSPTPWTCFPSEATTSPLAMRLSRSLSLTSLMTTHVLDATFFYWLFFVGVPTVHLCCIYLFKLDSYYRRNLLKTNMC